MMTEFLDELANELDLVKKKYTTISILLKRLLFTRHNIFETN